MEFPDSGSVTCGVKSKDEAQSALHDEAEQLGELQEKLFADGRRALLVVFQGMDTSGKDGTIRRVFGRMDPAGVRVASFKKPSPEEYAHDFLRRVHLVTPRRGEVVVFNRSHYEDVLVPWVKGQIDRERWRRRIGHLLNFERLLADEGTVIVKFFLHLGHAEQADRLRKRLEDPAKRWKFELADLESRQHWDDYQRAYRDVIAATHRRFAPWHVVPADRKWNARLHVARVLRETLAALPLRYPEGPDRALVPDIV